jgi:ABC-type Fe3+-hydroxamate transport system substrate-binding protein
MPTNSCIDKAGGIPVAATGAKTTWQYNLEQLIAWNPDIIFVRYSGDIAYVQSHIEFSG